jgi:glycogen debranching enzyme
VESFIRIEDRYYILADTSIADESAHVLKNEDTFAIFNGHGDIRPLGFEEQGVFFQGTRFLSRLVLKTEGKTPLLLGASVGSDNEQLVSELTNPEFCAAAGERVHRSRLHIARQSFLQDGVCFQRIAVVNYGPEALDFSLSLAYDADFSDIFEVRGFKRERRGERLETALSERGVVMAYRGLDGVLRRTAIEFDRVPAEMNGENAVFVLRAVPREETALTLSVSCLVGESAAPEGPGQYDVSLMNVRKVMRGRRHEGCRIETSNRLFNRWLERSEADLAMMLTNTPQGLYPYAGIPWFSTIFGRDGLLTAFETLWAYPDIARGVLRYLASNQAFEVLPAQDAEPGKILHEVRRGEMAALGEIPFSYYYGSVDSTPLFVSLVGQYYDRTADREFGEEMWPHVERALEWINAFGDPDGDGFVEYSRHAPSGLVHQGWKDSEDSVFHADGTLAAAPIALCEVQGYVYQAKLKAAQLAFAIERPRRGEALLDEATVLRDKFWKTFWSEEIGLYALALDGRKRPCLVRSSNAGQCLFSGIASPEHARSIARQIVGPYFFSGWGVRTIASSESRYNPMAYHNGSIWPHDNALIAYGLSRYGFKDAAMKIIGSLFDASQHVERFRLPELFCGFPRLESQGPTLYPVACDPQAWATASVFLLLQSCLGLSIQAYRNKIYFNYPALPPFLNEVTIRNLKIGPASIDIQLLRNAYDGVGVNVLRREGFVEVVTTK